MEQLVHLCEDDFSEEPITKFVLQTIFKEFIFNFWDDNQGVPVKDYEQISVLIPLILQAWEAPKDSRNKALEDLIKRLDLIKSLPH